MYLTVRTTFVVANNLWYVMHSISLKLESLYFLYLWHWLIFFSFSGEFLSFYEFGNFLLLLFLLITNFSLWWCDTIFLYMLKLALCLNMCPILKKVLWLAEKKEFFFMLGVWNVLSISIWSIWFVIFICFSISMLSFCLDDLPVGESDLLKHSTINVWE